MSGSPGSSTPIPSAKKEATTEFYDRDDKLGRSTGYSEHTRSTPEADIHTSKVYAKVELACGCYWPEREVGGRCARCASRHANADVCQQHHVICKSCGESCCWQHSRESKEDTSVRVCLRCHRKEKRRALLGWVGRILRDVFFEQASPGPAADKPDTATDHDATQPGPR